MIFWVDGFNVLGVTLGTHFISFKKIMKSDYNCCVQYLGLLMVSIHNFVTWIFSAKRIHRLTLTYLLLKINGFNIFTNTKFNANLLWPITYWKLDPAYSVITNYILAISTKYNYCRLLMVLCPCELPLLISDWHYATRAPLTNKHNVVEILYFFTTNESWIFRFRHCNIGRWQQTHAIDR